MSLTVDDIRSALWSDVRHVLLDMDGTLLDRYFDDYFWGEYIAEKYGEKHNIAKDMAMTELYGRFKALEGTLNWYDVDFWTKELDMDIPALKSQIRHLIKVHPHVEAFLRLLRQHKKMVILTTNAHHKTVALKMKETELGRYFDRIITCFDMDSPKEDSAFWKRIESVLNFDPDRTLFIDDRDPIISSAKKGGIRFALIKKKANSRCPDTTKSCHLSIDSFNELFP